MAYQKIWENGRSGILNQGLLEGVRVLCRAAEGPSSVLES